MTNAEPNADELLEYARDARQRNDEQASLGFLRTYLQRGRVLLWLAKLSSDPQEALAAAELAFRLDPADEVAQRAIRAAREQVAALPPEARTGDELSVAVMLTTGMTLREARAVIWPFRNINVPIGDALDAGRIGLRDLAWAVERIQGRVQTAARTILFAKVAGQEPAKPPRPLRVITGPRYAERQERRALIFAIFAAVAGLVISAALVVSSIVRWWDNSQWIAWISLVLLMSLGFYLTRLMERLAEKALFYRLGRWGEERAIEHLRALLDDRWTLFRNVIWPEHRGGDIDMVLVGPGGIWACEVKTYSGDIRNVDDRWERRGKRGWYTLFSHPGKQARTGAVRLKTFLNDQQIHIAFVNPVVIWASDPTDEFDVVGTLTVERPKTPVWTIGALPEHIERIIQEEPVLSSDVIEQIVSCLERIVAEARRQERQRTQRSRGQRSSAKLR
jgi:hypothetical protein